MLLALWGPSHSTENGKLMDSLLGSLSPSPVFPSSSWFCRSRLPSCFKRSSGGVLQTWLDCGDGRGRTDGSLRAVLLKGKGKMFWYNCRLLCAASEKSHAMWVLGLLQRRQSLAQHHLVVHFYSSGPPGPITIRGELSLHLWTSACVYQDLRCLGLLNLIFLGLH